MEEELGEEAAASQITVVGETADNMAAAAVPKVPVHLTPAGLSLRKGKKGPALKLSEITRPLSDSTKKIMMLGQ